MEVLKLSDSTKNNMADKLSSKSEILSVVGAQSETLENLSERILKIENSTEKQESRNHSITQVVLIGFVVIVVAVAVEVILSTKLDSSRIDQFNDKISGVQNQITEIKGEIDLLKARNSYLK